MNPKIDLLLTENEFAAIKEFQRQAKIPASTTQILHVIIEQGIKAIRSQPKRRVLSAEELTPR